MKIIGITGGIGSGKSSVLLYLKEQYQAAICQADEVARNLQKKGTRCYKRIVEHFGEKILDESGRINRAALAEIVFSDEKELTALNQIVHPAVREKITERMRREERNGTGIFILEAALLIEGHYDEVCDEMWYVYSDKETRKKRLSASRGYGAKKMEHIFAAQMPSEVFFDHCDRAIDNSGLFEETCEQLDEMMAKMMEETPGK